MNGNELTDLITEYYTARNLKFPNFHDAMEFMHTELGEVYELDLARTGGWVRNNPENKPQFSKDELGRELGDAIMMLIVAGLAEGVDPLESLEHKIREKMGWYNQGHKVLNADGMNVTQLTGKLVEIDNEKDGD